MFMSVLMENKLRILLGVSSWRTIFIGFNQISLYNVIVLMSVHYSTISWYSGKSEFGLYEGFVKLQFRETSLYGCWSELNNVILVWIYNKKTLITIISIHHQDWPWVNEVSSL